MHGQPVWSNKHGWLLTDSIKGVFLSTSNMEIPFKDAGELFYMAPAFMDEFSPTDTPIEYCNITSYKKIWVEPISKDTELRKELRGWYTVKNTYVENEYGNRFYFDTYCAKWLCYLNNNIKNKKK